MNIKKYFNNKNELAKKFEKVTLRIKYKNNKIKILL